MLTRLKEGSSGSFPASAKCYQYWPANKETPMRAGNYEICLVDESEFTPEITKRIFTCIVYHLLNAECQK